MYKFYRSVLAAGVVAMGLAACGDDVTVGNGNPGVTSVVVSPTSATVGIGQTIQLGATVTADSGVLKTVTWTSSNPTIASVSTSGAVTGLVAGSTTIIATADGDHSQTAAVQLTVSATQNGITAFSLAPASLALAPGDTTTLKPIFVKTDSTIASPTVSFTSLNGSIATVSSTGKVTALTTGTTAITGTVTVGGTQMVATTSIVVGQGASVSIISVNAGAGTPNAGLPVTLGNVAGQIDVNLNFDPGVQKIDSVIVSLRQGSKLVRGGLQKFNGNVPAAGVLVISIPTAAYTKNPAAGTAVTLYQNGQTTVSAQVFPTNAGSSGAVNCSAQPNDPTCSTPLEMVLNNIDGFAADNVKPHRSATDSAGNSSSSALGSTFWGGPGAIGADSAILYAIIYDSAGNGRTVTNVTWGIGSVLQTCNFADTFAPGAYNGHTVFSAAVAGDSDCTGHQNVTHFRDNIRVLSAKDNLGNNFPTTLLANTVQFGSTPDSLRVDWAGPSNVQRPSGEGWEGQHWVNANWQFNRFGTEIDDQGVGPAPSSWVAHVGPAFTTVITTGADLAETNTNTTDGYTAQATGADRLGNTSPSAITSTFGVDKTTPSLRYSATASPSSYASIYTGGGAATVLDSTTYNAVQGLYGTNIATAGSQDLFLNTVAGVNDSLRIEATDNRSGLFRGIEAVNRFAQGGATGTTTSVLAVNFTIFDGPSATSGFLPSTIDGWLPLHAEGVTAGSSVPGYYTSSAYVVDKAGNASGCPVTRATDGANGGACTAAAPAAGNLFARRTLALDPGTPQVTGVSPNNSYVGNAPVTFTLGSQNDLEVIDAKLRLLYPNLTIGDPAGTVPAANAGGLVWTYALSNTVLASSPNGNTFAGAASGTGANIGYFMPIATRWDNSIVNPSTTPLALDLFTTNVQETCTGVEPAAGTATGPTTATDCGTTTLYVGDPIPTDAGGIALTIPSNVGVQVRDVFGSWIFNTVSSTIATHSTGVSDEFVSPILSATVQAPVTTFGVTYGFAQSSGSSCPAGGLVQAAGSQTCVTGGINFRADNQLSSGATKVFRAVEPLSVSLPTFGRVDLYGLNAQQQWVFISRIVVPNPVSVSASCPSTTPGSQGVVGCDNGNERYWLYTFTNAPGLFTQYRAIGVDSHGSGLASTIHL